jgi:hypothetical protein
LGIQLYCLSSLHKPTFKSELHGLQNLTKGGELGIEHVMGMKTMKMNDEKTKLSLNPNTKHKNKTKIIRG